MKNLSTGLLAKESLGNMEKEKIVLEHVAIIPDGNRRWARKNGLKSSEGHKEGISFDRMIRLFKEAKKLGIKYFTIWLFSTENWKRDKEEVDYLFNLFRELSGKFRKYAIKNKIRFRHLGRKDRLPKDVIRELKETEIETKDFRELSVQICLDYGGRDEVVRAINKILKSGLDEVSEAEVKNYLDTVNIPDPDLIIRTSGENRMSGFMPFQSAYAEYYFTDIYFPLFEPKDLRKAVEEYEKRKRRFGGNL